MISYQRIVDRYTREAHAAYENAKRQGLYRNSKYVFCLLLLVTLFGYPDNQLLALSAEDNIPDLCELPEDVSAFKALIMDKVGEEISGSDIKLLKNQIEFTEGSGEVMDPFYSKSENVRMVALRKKCIAKDKVPYVFYLGVITDLLGNAIFSQAFLFYEKEDILNGKRKFSFDNLGSDDRHYTEIISKDTVGIMNKKQLEEYMQSLGCAKVATDKKDFAEFFYKREPEKYLFSRIIGGYDFSMQIFVDFDAEGIVKRIKIDNLGF